MVVRGTQQIPAEVGVPGQTIALLLMAPEPEVRAALPTGIWKKLDVMACTLLRNMKMSALPKNVSFGWLSYGKGRPSVPVYRADQEQQVCTLPRASKCVR